MKFVNFNKLFVLVLSLVFLMGFSVLNSGGKAGYTGSPGGPGTCANCHSGGSGNTSVTIQSVPPMANNEYVPNTLYRMQVTVANSNLNGFGFACEILDGSNVNAGTISNPGTGVKLANSGQRVNATHNGVKSGAGSATFEFDWTAPSAGSATIYVGANAVNNNGGTSGDAPTSTSLTLLPNTPTSKNSITDKQDFTIYPNPVKNEFFVQTHKKIAQVLLWDMTGKSHPISLQIDGNRYKVSLDERLAPGTYLIQIKTDSQEVYYEKIYISL